MNYCSDDCVEMYELSFAFNIAFTLANTSSSGIRSGLEGGRNNSRAPIPVMISCIYTSHMVYASVVHNH